MAGQPPDPAPAAGWPGRRVQQSGEGGRPSYKKEVSCGTTHHHHPKTVVVVAVVWVVVVTVGRANVVSIVDPRTAAQDAPEARLPQIWLPISAMNLI